MKFLVRMSALVLLATALISCSGGGSSSTTEPVLTPSVTVGTITGFGSVIVNGIRFDDSAAVITINDQSGTRAQLKVGMVVAVEGSVAACPNPEIALCEGVAAQIRFRNNLEGPITLLNRLTNTIQVMGREVQFDADTLVEGGSSPDINGLALGDIVAISGLEEQLRIRARLVQRLGQFVAGTTPMQALGTVANLNLADGSCTVDGVPVSFLGLAAESLPQGGLAQGQYVQVSGTGSGTGLITADRIQLRDRISYPDAALVQLEGFVSDYVSVADFVVADQRVDARDAIFRNGSAADLGNGAKVLIEGLMQDGVLIASKVVFRLEANAQTVNVQIGAPIQSKMTSTASLVVLGQSIQTTTLTQFIDRTSTAGASGAGSGGSPEALSYADLQVGDRVDVMAYRDAEGKFIATRIERTVADELLVAKGPVDSAMAPTQMNLFGIPVLTGTNTRYRDIDGNLISDQAFYTFLSVPPDVASIVRAQGVASMTINGAIDATRSTATRGEVEIAQ